MDEVEKKIQTFFEQFRQVAHKKGDIIMRPEEKPQHIFYLTTGTVKMYSITESGEQVTLTTFRPHSFFPMFLATDHVPNKYFFEAETPSTMHIAPMKDVLSFVQENNDVLFDLLRRVYRGMDGLLTRMSYLMQGSAYQRLVIELLIFAKRFGIQSQGATELHVSEKALAESSGLTRETISREMKHLKDKGLVTYKTNLLIIHNLSDLEAEMH